MAISREDVFNISVPADELICLWLLTGSVCFSGGMTTFDTIEKNLQQRGINVDQLFAQINEEAVDIIGTIDYDVIQEGIESIIFDDDETREEVDFLERTILECQNRLEQIRAKK